MTPKPPFPLSNSLDRLSMPRGIIFDLDGTLVSSSLNFPLIRQELDCPEGMDLLDYVNALARDQKEEAHQLIRRHELHDAESAQIIEGVHSVLAALEKADVALGIVTRNSREATAIKLERTGLAVDCVITREDAPPKPAPDALLQVARLSHVQPPECIYVGDYRYDLEAAHRAGMHACWYSNGNEHADYQTLAHFQFDCYDRFIPLLGRYWQSLADSKHPR